MSVYEIDYPARLTYQVEANSLEEAIAAADKIISAGVPLNAPFKTLNIKCGATITVAAGRQL